MVVSLPWVNPVQTVSKSDQKQFSSQIIAGFGFSPLNALLVQMPTGAFQLAGLLFASFMASYFKNMRLAMMILMTTLALVGTIIVYVLPNTNPWGRLVGIWLLAIFIADYPLSLSLIMSNVGGFSKKSTVSTMMYIGFSVGNIAGPQFFHTWEAPGYPVSKPLPLVYYSQAYHTRRASKLCSRVSLSAYSSCRVWSLTTSLKIDVGIASMVL